MILTHPYILGSIDLKYTNCYTDTPLDIEYRH